MSFFYGCPDCHNSLETPTRQSLRCGTCGRPMDLVATKGWIFKCSSCRETIDAGPEAEARSYQCPFCDEGIMYPSQYR
jgi:DNA-directed RNA polymerase subunit RPC12/RpoP